MAFIPIDEYAKIKGVSKQTVYDRIKKGVLKSVKESGKTYVEQVQREEKRDESFLDVFKQVLSHLKNVEEELKNLKELNEEILRKIEENTVEL